MAKQRKAQIQRPTMPNVLGEGVGHGALSKVPSPVEVETSKLPPHIARFMLAGALDITTRFFIMGGCSILLSRETLPGRDVQSWHISISHPKRYATWDEVAKARYTLIPNEVQMCMMLPPKEEYINIDEHCFQLWDVESASYQEQINAKL